MELGISTLSTIVCALSYYVLFITFFQNGPYPVFCFHLLTWISCLRCSYSLVVFFWVSLFSPFLPIFCSIIPLFITMPGQGEDVNPDPVMCTTYYEELKMDYPDLGRADMCPICLHFPLGYHHRDPTAAVAAISLKADNKEDAKASASRPGPSSSHAAAISKLATLMPKWTKDSVCRLFLQRVGQLLSTSDVPKTKWPIVLIHIVTDVMAAEWITLNIIDKGLSWDEACDTFTAHFQSSDYSVTLERDYDECR